MAHRPQLKALVCRRQDVGKLQEGVSCTYESQNLSNLALVQRTIVL